MFAMRHWMFIGVVATYAVAATDTTNLLRNPGFEEPLSTGWFGLWDVNSDVNSRGTVSLSITRRRTGTYGLRLDANTKNKIDPSYYDFGIAQRLPKEQLRGKNLLFQAWMRAEGGASAVLRVVAVAEDGTATVRFIRADSEPVKGIRLAFRRDIFEVPDVELKELFIICSVQGTSGTAFFDDVLVSSALADRWQIGQPDPGPELFATVTVDYRNVLRRIPRDLFGMNIGFAYNGYGLWDWQTQHFDQHLLNLSRDLGVTSWRFPGGLFANYYHWRNGVGPRENRPVTTLMPTRGASDHNFGTDEALEFADVTNASLLMTVNAHTGTPEEAADWVRYVKSRGKDVRYWEVGNELYFYQNRNDPTGPVWTPGMYASAFLDFAKAMREADPTIKIAADMEFNLTLDGCGVVGPDGCWADVLIKQAGRQIDVLALHNGLAPLLINLDSGLDVRTVYAGMMSAPAQIKKLLGNLTRKVDALGGADAKRIRFAMVEWGPLFHADPKNRFIDHVKTLGSALLTASLMKVLMDEPRMDIAHAFALVDPWTQGWIGPRGDTYIPKALYYAFQLYATTLGPQLLETQTFSPVFNTRSVGLVPATEAVPYLDVTATADDANSSLRLMVVNKHFDRTIRVAFQAEGFSAIGPAEIATLTGTALDANTGTELKLYGDLEADHFAPQAELEPERRFSMGSPNEIWIERRMVEVRSSCFEIEFPKHSVSSVVIPGVKLPYPTSTSGCEEEAQQRCLGICGGQPD